MSEFKEHQPHFLTDATENEIQWCGGTQPPTLVRFKTNEESAFVDIFTDDKFVHEGVLGIPEKTLEFLHSFDRPITQETVSLYACNALASHLSTAKL